MTTTAKTIPPLKVSPKSPLRIALVEDQPNVRESWSKLIDSFPDLKCIGVCKTGEEALRSIPEMQPDVVLMDIFLPRLSGIECTARLKELMPQLRIVILTAMNDEELVFMALEAGADGYLLKRTKPAELRSALLDVLGGGAPMTSEIARRVIESFRLKAKARDDRCTCPFGKSRFWCCCPRATPTRRLRTSWQSAWIPSAIT